MFSLIARPTSSSAASHSTGFCSTIWNRLGFFPGSQQLPSRQFIQETKTWLLQEVIRETHRQAGDSEAAVVRFFQANTQLSRDQCCTRGSGPSCSVNGTYEGLRHSGRCVALLTAVCQHRPLACLPCICKIASVKPGEFLYSFPAARLEPPNGPN